MLARVHLGLELPNMACSRRRAPDDVAAAKAETLGSPKRMSGSSPETFESLHRLIKREIGSPCALSCPEQATQIYAIGLVGLC